MCRGTLLLHQENLVSTCTTLLRVQIKRKKNGGGSSDLTELIDLTYNILQV